MGPSQLQLISLVLQLILPPLVKLTKFVLNSVGVALILDSLNVRLVQVICHQSHGLSSRRLPNLRHKLISELILHPRFLKKWGFRLHVECALVANYKNR